MSRTFSGSTIDLTIKCKFKPCDGKDCLACYVDKLEAVKEAAENLMFGANSIVVAHRERLQEAIAELSKGSGE